MQTTCAAMDAFVQVLEALDDFSGPPVVMSTAEEAPRTIHAGAKRRRVDHIGVRVGR